MSYLSTAELASMQATAAQTMTDACLVQRATLMPDGMGSEVEQWNTVATTVARLGVPTGGYITAQAAALTETATWLVHLPFGTSVKIKDRLVLDSQTLVVQAVYSPETITTEVRVLASELR